MLVRYNMSARVVTVGPQESIDTARRMLERHGVRQLPVVHDGLLVGIVTDRDLRSAAPEDERVETVMTRDPIAINPGQSVDEAAREMRRAKVNALPVLDGEELVGILTTSDILEAFIRLSGVSEPTYRLVLDAGDAEETTDAIHSILVRLRAEVLWLRRGRGHQRTHVHARLRTDRVDEIEAALEAAGFSVLATISSVERAED